ncbi:hypothetical protein ACH9EU_00625 [Kocuria sp. M1R5S2]|uniref:hypothetical protein n=1 Tax=Kocuria rhizosphaerae TaxID=3376285 RepID=UPI0037B41F1D
MDVTILPTAAQVAAHAAGGIDLQLLGIGTNGHIGFNEPITSLRSRTRVAAPALQTRSDNARFFDRPEAVPTHCVTQGLGTILEARRILLVAQGARRAAAGGLALGDYCRAVRAAGSPVGRGPSLRPPGGPEWGQRRANEEQG